MKKYLKMSLLFALVMGMGSAQSTIQGIVTDNNGNALAGANVVVDGTSMGAAADNNGDYRIDVPGGTIGGANLTVTVSYIGHTSQSVQVDVPMSGSATQNFSLVIDAIGLKAVSVTAL